jgi:hypothetical protein
MAQLDRTKDNCTLGTTTLYYDARCVDDLYAMLQ